MIDLDTRDITVRQQLRWQKHAHGCGDPVGGVSACTVEKRRTAGNPKLKPITGNRCPQRIDGSYWIVATTKNDKIRRVRFSKSIADDLRELYAAQHTETVTKKERARLARSRAMARYPAEDADLVIVTPGPNPGPVSKYIDNDVFHAALAAVDVSAIGRDVHAARHTAATNLVAAGVPLTTVRKRLGHSSLAVTQRYVTTGGDAQEAGLEMLELHLARALRE